MPFCERIECKYNQKIVYEPDMHCCAFLKYHPETEIKLDENGKCISFKKEDNNES